MGQMTGRQRINFSRWGRKLSGLAFATYAVAQDGESPIDAVVRSVERTTGLQVCGGPRSDGYAVERGHKTAAHYQMTLGRPCRGGGWSPEAELWVSIPVEVR